MNSRPDKVKYQIEPYIPEEVQTYLSKSNYSLTLFKSNNPYHENRYLTKLAKIHETSFTSNTLDYRDKFFWAKPLQHIYTFLALDPYDDVIGYARFSLQLDVPSFDDKEENISYVELDYISVDEKANNRGIGSVLLAALFVNANSLNANPAIKASRIFLYSVDSAWFFYMKGGEFTAENVFLFNMNATLPINTKLITNRIEKFKPPATSHPLEKRIDEPASVFLSSDVINENPNDVLDEDNLIASLFNTTEEEYEKENTPEKIIPNKKRFLENDVNLFSDCSFSIWESTASPASKKKKTIEGSATLFNPDC